MITCKEIWESLSDYLDGELHPTISRELEKHLKECFFCSRLFNTLNKTLSLCQEEFFSFPSSLHQMIMESLKEMKLLPEEEHLKEEKRQAKKEPALEEKEVIEMVRREEELTPWDPFHDLFDFRDAFDRFFGRAFSHFRERPHLLSGTWRPEIDVIDRKDSILVKAVLPGVDKKDINISIRGDILTIQAKTKKEKEIEEGDYYYAELKKGSFSRTFTLPTRVIEDKIKASYKDGILEINLPKVKEARVEEKKIKIE